jgi:hypothetical protein
LQPVTAETKAKRIATNVSLIQMYFMNASPIPSSLGFQLPIQGTRRLTHVAAQHEFLCATFNAIALIVEMKESGVHEGYRKNV